MSGWIQPLVMAFVPLVNLWVGTVVGASLGGVLGFAAGALGALLITTVEIAIFWRGEQSAFATDRSGPEDAQRPQQSAARQGIGRFRQAVVSLTEWQSARKAEQGRRAVESSLTHGKIRRRAAA